MGVRRHHWLILLFLALLVSIAQAEIYTLDGNRPSDKAPHTFGGAGVGLVDYDHNGRIGGCPDTLSISSKPNHTRGRNKYGVSFDARRFYRFTFSVAGLSGSRINTYADACILAQSFGHGPEGLMLDVRDGQPSQFRTASELEGRENDAQLIRKATYRMATDIGAGAISLSRVGAINSPGTTYSLKPGSTYNSASTMATPEPATTTLALVACGACAVFIWRRKREKESSD